MSHQPKKDEQPEPSKPAVAQLPKKLALCGKIKDLQKDYIDTSDEDSTKSVIHLDLTKNGLSSVSGIDSFSSLTMLNLATNTLTAPSLKPLRNISSLVVLNLSHNRLASIPRAIRRLPSLRALILTNNAITSLAGVEHLTGLNTLVISRNPITDIPEGTFPSLASLRKLSMSSCGLTVLPTLRNLQIRDLKVAGNQLTTLNGLEKCPELNTLDISSNPIDSKGLGSLKHLVRLRQISARRCPRLPIPLGTGRRLRVNGLELEDYLSGAGDEETDGATSTASSEGLRPSLAPRAGGRRRRKPVVRAGSRKKKG